MFQTGGGEEAGGVEGGYRVRMRDRAGGISSSTWSVSSTVASLDMVPESGDRSDMIPGGAGVFRKGRAGIGQRV